MVDRLPDSYSNWNLELLVFEERRKNRSTQRKSSRSKGENQQQTICAMAPSYATKIPQGFTFLCKIGLLIFKAPSVDYQI